MSTCFFTPVSENLRIDGKFPADGIIIAGLQFIFSI